MNEKYEIVKFIDNEFELDVNASPQNDAVWLTASQMASLLNKDEKAMRKHINNVLKKMEVLKEINMRKMRVDGVKQLVLIYSLNVTILVGYRVKSKKGFLFRRWANNVVREYLLRGYIIDKNISLVTNENYVRLIIKVGTLDDRVGIVGKEIKMNKPKLNKLFFDDEFYDANSLIQQILESVNNEIIIIDNYINRTILDRLIAKNEKIKVTIYTDFTKPRLQQIDVNTFNRKHGLLGGTIKDLGSKIFSIIESDSIIELLIGKM